MPPGTQSALRHWHEVQDEFVYILEGEPVLLSDAGETPLRPGLCCGFPGGRADGHVLVNRSDRDVVYLEVGDRPWPDPVHYPDDDLLAEKHPGGVFIYRHRDGTRY